MRRHRLPFFAFGLVPWVLMTASRAGDPGSAAADDHALIKGTWQLVYAESEGKLAPVERIRNVRVEIKEGTHSVYFGDQQVARDIHFTMNPQATPKTTDDTLNDGPEAEKQIHGIYELDDDSLLSCVAKVGQDRPKEFTTKPGSGHTLRVFKRVRPDEPAREKAIREELMQFGGLWKMSELVIGGKQPKEGAGPFQLVLRGDRWQSRTADGITSGFFRVDPTQRPRTIDVHFSDGPEKGETLRGIYELTGDTYKVCLNMVDEPRPSELVSKPGSQQVLEVFKRETP
jgi:uncharacterized protein (TIGR03067 family)